MIFGKNALFRKRSFEPANVLIVDDEPPVRKTLRRVLTALGHNVIEARDGVEGLAALRLAEKIDLVVADLEMPLLGGSEMTSQIRASHPDVKILYVTACIDSLLDKRSLWQDEAFLEKPFTVTGFREAVSLLLYGSTRSAVSAIRNSRDARCFW